MHKIYIITINLLKCFYNTELCWSFTIKNFFATPKNVANAKGRHKGKQQ